MGNWREEIRLVLQPYYALHLISVPFYFLVRFLALPSISAASQYTFVRWEAQAVLSLGMVLVVKFGRRNTLEGFLGDVVLYIKCALAVLVAILDPRVLAWYLFAFSAIFLLWYQPTFSGSDNVIDLTPLQLENNLLENHAAWLVEFGAPWSPRCNHFRRIFAGLSLKYSNPALRFGRIDVRCFPKTTSKYHIEFGVALRQLPTLVLFEGGVESSRLPQSAYEGMTFVPTLTETMVVQHFELDQKLIQALSKKAALEQGESLAK